jgi:hypothetical protein
MNNLPKVINCMKFYKMELIFFRLFVRNGTKFIDWIFKIIFTTAEEIKQIIYKCYISRCNIFFIYVSSQVAPCFLAIAR